MEATKKTSTTRRIFRWAAWITGGWIFVLILLELILRSSAVTGMINRTASEYVDGELTFGKVEVSLFRHFPSATMSLHEFSIT